MRSDPKSRNPKKRGQMVRGTQDPESGSEEVVATGTDKMTSDNLSAAQPVGSKGFR